MKSLIRIGLSLSVISVLLFMPEVHAQKNKRKRDRDKEQEMKQEAWEMDTLIQAVPRQRVYIVDKIEKLIVKIDARDGAKDSFVKFRDEASSEIVTQALIRDASRLIVIVENLEIDHRQKMVFHTSTANLLDKLNKVNWAVQKPKYFSENINTLRGMMLANAKGNLLGYVKENTTLTALDLIDNFEDDEAKAYLYTKLGTEYPEILIQKLPKIMNESYADPIIAAAAKVIPGTILTYARRSSSLSGVVRRNSDPLVQNIVKIADNTKNTLKVLPFLGAISRGEKTISEVDAIANDDDKYLQGLVDLLVADEKMGRKAIEDEIKIRTLKYVRKINELHNSPDATRFASIQQFRDVDYYVMIIGGQDEIYTSSFTKGPFALMMKKMETKSGKDLLTQLHFYHFRTFIRLSAGFNRLSDFLGTMKEEEKTGLMKDFVAGLENGRHDELEDAVDVADAYGSIKDPALITFLKDEIVSNYKRMEKISKDTPKYKKGIIIYGLLATIFKSSENSAELEGDLTIPPITYVPYSQLKGEADGVVEQVFFYGDDDGKTAYADFIAHYRGKKEWKVEENTNWVKITSTGDNKLVVYANKPLTEPQDEEAQKALEVHLNDNNIIPTVFIHRGHSYFVPTTLSYLTPDVKVVMLGSCGGYHNLAGVLDRAPDAHIISSKQTGTKNVNMVLTTELHKQLLSGKDLNWLNMWNNLDTFFAKANATDRGYFLDYIPPQRNLGAIFIKAYRNIEDGI